MGTPEQSGDGSPKTTVKVKGKSPPPKGGDGAQSSQVGKSPKKQSGAYWKEGCLQSELMQFHLKKGLAAAGANKEPDNGQPAEMEGWRAASGFHELQDEVERLKEENESLKVRRELSMAAIVSVHVVMSWGKPGLAVCQLLDIHLALMSAAFISLQCLICSCAAHLHHSAHNTSLFLSLSLHHIIPLLI